MHPLELCCFILPLLFPESMVYFIKYEIPKFVAVQIVVKLCSLV